MCHKELASVVLADKALTNYEFARQSADLIKLDRLTVSANPCLEMN